VFAWPQSLIFECPHGYVLWLNFAWISNHHDMHFMEMIWASLSFWAVWPSRYPDIHYVLPFASLLSQTSISFYYLGLDVFAKTKKQNKTTKKKGANKKRDEEKRINQSKIEEKQRKIEKKNKFFGVDNVWTMCRIVGKEKYQRKTIVTWLKSGRWVKWSPDLVTNQIFVSALVPHRTKE